MILWDDDEAAGDVRALGLPTSEGEGALGGLEAGDALGGCILGRDRCDRRSRRRHQRGEGQRD